jgi:opacity protein-like surface antigen
MKHQSLAKVLVPIFCLVTASVQAQYYSQGGVYNPHDIGPYSRFDIGASVFENGHLNQFGGPVNQPVDYDVGFNFDAAFGYKFNRYLGADFEFGVIGTQINSVPGFFSSNTYLDNVPFVANLTLSLPIPRTLIVPYIGGGAGGSWASFNTDGFGTGPAAVYGYESDVVFAWQAFAGVRIKLNKKMSLGVGYKYFVTQDTAFTYPNAVLGAPSVTVGLSGTRSHSAVITFQALFW